MQKLMQSRLFRLLSEPSQSEDYISQVEKSCDEFALQVLEKLQSETNYYELYFSLGFIHTKLAGVYERLSGGEEKKCPENRGQGNVSRRIGYAGFEMANHCTER
jgi:hypothetical protein